LPASPAARSQVTKIRAFSTRRPGATWRMSKARRAEYRCMALLTTAVPLQKAAPSSRMRRALKNIPRSRKEIEAPFPRRRWPRPRPGSLRCGIGLSFEKCLQPKAIAHFQFVQAGQTPAADGPSGDIGRRRPSEPGSLVTRRTKKKLEIRIITITSAGFDDDLRRRKIFDLGFPAASGSVPHRALDWRARSSSTLASIVIGYPGRHDSIRRFPLLVMRHRLPGLR